MGFLYLNFIFFFPFFSSDFSNQPLIFFLSYKKKKIKSKCFLLLLFLFEIIYKIKFLFQFHPHSIFYFIKFRLYFLIAIFII
jgi:hypothetical protein